MSTVYILSEQNSNNIWGVYNSDIFLEHMINTLKLNNPEIELKIEEKIINTNITKLEINNPTFKKNKLIIDNKEFIDAVDRVSTVSSDKTRAIKFELSDKQLIISAENPDQGSAKEHLNVHYTGDKLDIGFNSRYLLDIAKQISGAQVKFLLSDKLSPTLIFDDDDKQALYLLMPMHI